MPFGWSKRVKGIPESLRVPDDIADLDPRPRRLTGELLDWVTEAMTAVLSTDLGEHKAARQALVRALKHVDHLYPLTLETYEPREPTEPGGSDLVGTVEVVGLRGDEPSLGPAGHDALG